MGIVERSKVMKNAVKILQDKKLRASYEYPGFILVTFSKLDFRIGDANTDYTGDYGSEGSNDIEGTFDNNLPRTATDQELADYICRNIGNTHVFGISKG